ncbi:motility associated factor glycosyltransferase family protein [Hwanghaeella sp.]|uniref:motility associated factor glycosyltransferase family protein n=1 Tax=Hwanghaeella sp. TaxID=2605943 RepID=UPI003CCC211F
MTTSSAEPKTLYERNLIALAEHVSFEFAQSLATLQSDLELVTEPKTGLLNIRVGERTMYPTGAEPFAARQVAEYLEKPQRLSLRPPPPDPNSNLVSDRAVASLHNRFGSKLVTTQRDPELISGYLTIFGLGLGLQISPLLERLNVRNLVIADGTPAFLALSMQAIEWAEIIATLADRGGRVHFAFDADPVALSNKVYEAMRGPDRGLLDGSYIFGHYRMPVLERALSLFMESVPVIGDSDGFFEDECLMLWNAAANLADKTVRILSPTNEKLDVPPAIVVGSGPSIDAEIETIRRLRDRCLLISGGTGMGVLLEAGLKPDFHCEIENVPDILTVNQTAAVKHDLAGIRLIAASTVDPLLPPLFEETIFVLREALSPTRLFGNPDLVLPMAGPTVTHLACRTAMTFGCRDIYLFGVDLGSVEADRHHSGASIYNLSDDPYWRGGAAMEKLTIPAAGNFREQVFTSREFAFARLYFSTLASLNPDFKIHNCSDGVRIEGAPAKRGAELDLPPVTTDAASLIAGLPVLTVPQASVDRAMQSLGHAMSVLAPNIAGMAGHGASDIEAINDGLKAALAGRDGDSPEATAQFMMAGTLQMVLQTGNSLYGRVSPGRRPEVVAETAKALARATWEMAEV